MPTFFAILSGEYLLKARPNGGGVVLARSLHVSIAFYAISIVVKEITASGALIEFSQTQLKSAIHQTIPWFGAIFAASYASFYARYSSQWTYLANTYNQFMAVKSGLPEVCLAEDKALIAWQAGFVSDCYILHLDRKPIFSGIIMELLKNVQIKDEILSNFEGDDKKEFVKRHAS